VPSRTDAGALTHFSLHFRHVRLAISDSIDFCPGGLGTTTRQLLLPLSRLERTPLRDGGWVHPVLWKTLAGLPDEATTVTTDRQPVRPAPADLLSAISRFLSRVVSAADRLLGG
jgi:hypothetical protein